MSTSPFGSLPQRAFVALIAIPVIVWTTLTGGYAFFLFVACISALALYEFYRLTEARGAAPLKIVGIAFGFLLNGAFIYDRTHGHVFQTLESIGLRLSMFSQQQYALVILLIFLVVVLSIEVFRTRGSALANVGATVAGVAVVSLFFGTLIATRELFPFGFPSITFLGTGTLTAEQADLVNRWGGWTIMSVFVSIWTCDTAAYFGGLTFGRHRLFERVSPKKSWEGAVFGFVFAVAAMLVMKHLTLEYLSWTHAAVLGVIIGSLGQLGDLVESRLKRDAGVKDSSAIIPGHGGVYDRFDSLVFLAPVIYIYIDFIVLS